MKKKVLAAAISTGLALSAAGTAQADSLLFPYFEQGAGVFSFLSLSTVHAGPDAPNNLHYIWNYNDPILGSCTHADQFGTMTNLDLIQQTVVDPSLPGGVDIPALYGDVSTPRYLSVSPTEGFMTVQDFLAPEGGFWGQMILVNTVNGTIGAQKGMNDPGNASANTFTSILTSQAAHLLTWYPTDVVDTSWQVLVTGSGMSNPVGWAGARTLTNALLAGILDRDENFFSGTRDREVVCYDRIDRTDLLNANQLANTADGGVAVMVNLTVPPPAGNSIGTETGVLMSKIETTAALGGSRTAISSENAVPNLPY